MLCLTFIQPIIVVWQTYFSGWKVVARANNNLFFGPYHPVMSPELSQNLAQYTQRLLNIRIPLSLWRHVATWFLNYHSVWFCEHHILSNCTSLAVQSSHSEGAHALYVADVQLPAGINFHAFFNTMHTSSVLLDFCTSHNLPCWKQWWPCHVRWRVPFPWLPLQQIAFL